MVNVNHFQGATDNDILENAIRAREADGIVLIPPRRVEGDPARDYWLLDRAILLPENTTVILQNCRIKLSDRCRDNFFRSANCGLGIEDPAPIENIHIRGEGLCILEGADHPRATGDGGKCLHAPCPHFPEDLCRCADWLDPDHRLSPDRITFSDVHSYSYGTDAGVEGESQYGDWRGIGILLANVNVFSISGVRIVNSHGWGISLEACSNGCVERIDFDACMHKQIDGMFMNMENQDGIDLRNGCHHIVVSDITGRTGDDVIALTAIASPNYRPGGSLCNTHVMHNDWSRRERDIHDIIIRNVIAHSYLCYTVRLLPALAHIYNVVIDGVIDTTPDCENGGFATIDLTEGGYAGPNDRYPDALRNVTITNVICNSRRAINMGGYMVDSLIANVINRNPNCPVLTIRHPETVRNLVTSHLVEAGGSH